MAKKNDIFHNGYNLFLYISQKNCTIYDIRKYHKNIILVMLGQKKETLIFSNKAKKWGHPEKGFILFFDRHIA